MCPLKRCEGLGNEEGGADRNLAFAVSLLLGNLIIALCNPFRQPGNALLVLLRLRGKAQHKIQLHLIPAALKGIPGALKNHFLRKAFVNNIPQALGAGLRRKGNAALADILNLAHHIQRKSVNPQGRKGDIYALLTEIFHKVGHKLRKPGIIAGTEGA